MNLVGFSDVDPKDPSSVSAFLDRNALAHIEVHNALLEQGVVVPATPLTYEAIGQDFLQLNARECRSWADVLSLSLPPNISTVNPENDTEMRDWFNDYQLFVNQVAVSLGL